MPPSGYHVLYLTGAPAAGKSSIGKRLKEVFHPLEIFEYGLELTQYINREKGHKATQNEVRAKSAGIITREDVQAVDNQLLLYVSENRARTNIIIDTHAVTKEHYGFRVTPFSLDQIERLAPTEIVVLYVEPSVSQKRISSDPQGRPLVTLYESSLHTSLQMNVALSYGTKLGVPVYLIDADQPLDAEVDWFVEKLKSPVQLPS